MGLLFFNFVGHGRDGPLPIIDGQLWTKTAKERRREALRDKIATYFYLKKAEVTYHTHSLPKTKKYLLAGTSSR